MSTTALRPVGTPKTPRQLRESLAGVTIDSPESYGQTQPLSSSSTGAQQTSEQETQSRFLVNSPYSEIEHQLDLSSVEKPYQLLAQALSVFKLITSNHATTPYELTFNWSEIFANLRRIAAEENYTFPRVELYIIEFRSLLKENYDGDLLWALDKHSHREATASGGLLKYWYGSPDANRRNLATCLWRSKKDALTGGIGPWHGQARTATSANYESVNIYAVKLVIEEGVNSWTFDSHQIHALSFPTAGK